MSDYIYELERKQAKRQRQADECAQALTAIHSTRSQGEASLSALQQRQRGQFKVMIGIIVLLVLGFAAIQYKSQTDLPERVNYSRGVR